MRVVSQILKENLVAFAHLWAVLLRLSVNAAVRNCQHVAAGLQTKLLKSGA